MLITFVMIYVYYQDDDHYDDHCYGHYEYYYDDDDHYDDHYCDLYDYYYDDDHLG